MAALQNQIISPKRKMEGLIIGWSTYVTKRIFRCHSFLPSFSPLFWFNNKPSNSPFVSALFQLNRSEFMKSENMCLWCSLVIKPCLCGPVKIFMKYAMNMQIRQKLIVYFHALSTTSNLYSVSNAKNKLLPFTVQCF